MRFFFREELKLIAKSLDRLVTLKQYELAHRYGLSVHFDDERRLPEEGEIFETEDSKVAEFEALKEKYASQTGIEPAGGYIPGPLDPNGNPWPSEIIETEQQGGSVPIEDPEGSERTTGSSRQGFISVGPEGAEGDEETSNRGRGKERAPAGHIPR